MNTAILIRCVGMRVACGALIAYGTPNSLTRVEDPSQSVPPGEG